MRLGSEGLKAIEEATEKARTDKTSAIIRLFAIGMTFYRHPVGDQAFAALRVIVGEEHLNALLFLAGYSLGAEGRTSAWEELAFPANHQPPATSHQSPP